ncbi:MAG TPA: enoyl-CoA hydratase-related protein [Mycobacterium sp.]|nr:enoyl-CoA hydratase-related protein [Mycobacterium sp.]
MSDVVEVSVTGSSVQICLNRPERRNALTAAMCHTLADTLLAAEANPQTTAVLLSGSGAGFCAGNDLQDFLSAPQMGEDSPVMRFLSTVAGLTVPIVAAVRGAAVGIGATMLLHCDYVVADSSARLHYAFVPLGLVPAGAQLLLPRAVGQLRAAQLLLAEPIAAQHSHQLGLVTEVVEAGNHLARAHQIAAKLARQPTRALRLTKQLLRLNKDSVPGRLREEMAIFRQQVAGPEFASAVAAFTQRRTPTRDASAQQYPLRHGPESGSYGD